MNSPQSLDDAANHPEYEHLGQDCPSPKHPRRVTVACLRCRERKVRCSGTNPCQNCTRRSSECIFAQEDRRVTVTESYLTNLKRKAGANASSPPHQQRQKRDGMPSVTMTASAEAAAEAPSGQPAEDNDASLDPDLFGGHLDEGDEGELSGLKNPLVVTPSKVLTDDSGRRRFLGPSSTWAYSQHVMSMIRQCLSDHASPDIPLHVDGAALPLEFPNMRQTIASISMQDMPTMDYAIYLANTVKFHISQTHHIFDETSFMSGLLSLYNDGPQPITPHNRLWYVQYLLIVGLGKALLVGRGQGDAPAGSECVMRAIELLPDVSGLYQDPLLAVEIFCGLALYLQSIDHRNSAYVYLGSGLRIALSQGFHRELSGDLGSAHLVRQCSAWWTLYILDRKLSSLMGAPSSIHDSDITAPLPVPNQTIQRANALQMHVKLSRLIAEVLNKVYGVDGWLDSSFIKNIKVVLQKLADLGTELNANPELAIDSGKTIGRVPATLNLCYHQCIVLTTRPLLACLLQDKLKKRSETTCPSAKPPRVVSEPIKALLRSTYDSAQKSLLILERLRAQHLLEVFLPFDLDHAFSAAFVLTMLSALQPFPEGRVDDTYALKANTILDHLVDSGCVPARFRREEFKKLRQLLPDICDQPDDSRAGGGGGSIFDPQFLQEDVNPQLQSNLDPFPTVRQGVSPDQVLNIVNSFGAYDFDAYPDLLGDNTWMWSV